MQAIYPDGSTFLAVGNLRDVLAAAEHALLHGAERVIIIAAQDGEFRAVREGGDQSPLLTEFIKLYGKREAPDA